MAPAPDRPAPPRLRALLFAPSLGQGGADRVFAKLVAGLDRSRFAPELALIRREGTFLSDVPGDVPVHALGTARLATSLPALARLLAARRPDVVLSAGAANIVVALAHAAARSGARLVLSERSALRRSDRSRARLAVELPAKRVTYRRADAVAAVSEGVARALVAELGLPAARVVVVGNPIVDGELAALAAEPAPHPWLAAPPGSPPVIVACGRLVAVKDYPTLLAAFARVRAAHPARLIVLGDGPLRADLEARAAGLGIGADVAFAGFDKNPFRYFARARLLLHASRAEGLPGAIIQAMACGAPVVGTNCDFGPGEVIPAAGRGGFLVPLGDAAALAERALALIADDALHAATAAAARAEAARYAAPAALARYAAVLAGDRLPAAWPAAAPRDPAAPAAPRAGDR
jgi:glycosyltransferase involved in cell wall biosynthesis